MLHFTRESQELYRSPALPLEPRAREPDEARGAQAILDADHAVRMAKTLADGSFPEEAPALLAKSLRAMTTALMSAHGETPSGAESDIDAYIRRLVECGALPANALALLKTMRSASGAATADEVPPLLASTTRILTTIGRNEPILAARKTF